MNRVLTFERKTNGWCFLHIAPSPITYVLSLRGSEGFLLDLEGLHKHWTRGWPQYFIVALLGQVKGETNDCSHLLPCVSKTDSGIQVLDKLTRLVKLKEGQGLTKGPAISNTTGIVYSTNVMDTCLLEILEDLYTERQDLFPPSLTDKEELGNVYQTFRSFRRASVSRAAERGLNTNDINIINRWNTNEKAKGRRPGMVMRQHYTQMELIIKPFLRYTQAM